MSEIDLMSRMSDDENLDSQRIRRVCPSLTASLMIDMATSILHALFILCDQPTDCTRSSCVSLDPYVELRRT